MGKPKRQQSDVAKAPKPLSKRGISFRALVVAPLVVALVVQAIVCYFVILRSDSLTMLEEDTYNLFAERVSSRAGYLENDMVMRWSETGETAQKLADTVSAVLSEHGADASDIGAASPLALEIIDRAAARLDAENVRFEDVLTQLDEQRQQMEREKDEARRLRRLIEGLPARERKLILLRYGLAGQPPLTQLETAQLLQISRSYVSRLETHALEQLRKGWLQESPGE